MTKLAGGMFLANPNDPLHFPPSERKKKKAMDERYLALAREIKLASGDSREESPAAELIRLREKKAAMSALNPTAPVGSPVYAAQKNEHKRSMNQQAMMGAGSPTVVKTSESLERVRSLKRELLEKLSGGRPLAVSDRGKINVGGGEDEANDKLSSLSLTQRARLDKVASQYVEDWEYMDEMEKQALFSMLARGAGRVAGALARKPSLVRGAEKVVQGGAGHAAVQGAEKVVQKGGLLRKVKANYRLGRIKAKGIAPGGVRKAVAKTEQAATKATTTAAGAGSKATAKTVAGAGATTAASKPFLTTGRILKGGAVAAGVGTLYAGKKGIDAASRVVDPRYSHGTLNTPQVYGQGRVF